MTIAVTGPFASGKSTLVRLMGEIPGTETASADEIVHHLLKNDLRTIYRVVERFGEGVRGADGIDRKALGHEVFGDAEALRDLEEILHPLVREETDSRIEASGARMFVVEIPLLFETDRGKDFDYTVAVTVPEERRKAWSEERGLDAAALRAMEVRQLSGKRKPGGPTSSYKTTEIWINLGSRHTNSGAGSRGRGEPTAAHGKRAGTAVAGPPPARESRFVRARRGPYRLAFRSHGARRRDADDLPSALRNGHPGGQRGERPGARVRGGVMYTESRFRPMSNLPGRPSGSCSSFRNPRASSSVTAE